ncbi:MAG: peptidylprolyl isomerase, partial [Lachnospiraceae bacterium]|nr:peptidylprolyl isomerase [Lachnospiraceae bacterium]
MTFFKKAVVSGLLIACLFYFASCGRNSDKKIIFTSGFPNNEVFCVQDEYCTYQEFALYLVNTANRYSEVYGERIWETAVEDGSLYDNMKTVVLSRLVKIKIMYLLAKDMNITLEEDEQELVQKAAQEYYESLSEKDCNNLGIKEDTVRSMYEQYAITTKAYMEIIKDVNPEISDDEARSVSVGHILISFNDKKNSRKTISEDEKQAVYNKAKKVYGELNAPDADFALVASAYSDDKEIFMSVAKGDLPGELEDVVFSLANDELSKITESDDGYHIFKCISTLDRDETDLNKIKLAERRKNEAFSRIYDEFADSLGAKINEKVFEKISSEEFN